MPSWLIITDWIYLFNNITILNDIHQRLSLGKMNTGMAKKLNYSTTKLLYDHNQHITENMALLRGLYLAGTEPHAEFASSGVASVPWLCFNIHSITFTFTTWLNCCRYENWWVFYLHFNSNKIDNSSCNYNFDFSHMTANVKGNVLIFSCGVRSPISDSHTSDGCHLEYSFTIFRLSKRQTKYYIMVNISKISYYIPNS